MHYFAYQRVLAFAIIQSYTRQSADLLWQWIDLETLDIFAMVHHAIADRVRLRNELRQDVFLL